MSFADETPRCSFCRADATEQLDTPEPTCSGCSVLLNPATRCACGGPDPVKMVDGLPRCLRCLNVAWCIVHGIAKMARGAA